MDPETAFVHPGSVVRVIHSDLGVMMIGGLSALMLQALHPLAMAGVADHSSYEDDPIGRLRRTANFVGTTTFGTTAEAREAIRHVKAVHRRVRGVAPDGRPYSADDPELLTWVHAAEMYCFLEASQRFGTRRLSKDECDAYYKQTAPVAIELGAEWVPSSVDEMHAYFLRLRHDLYGGPQALAAPGLPPPRGHAQARGPSGLRADRGGRGQRAPPVGPGQAEDPHASDVRHSRRHPGGPAPLRGPAMGGPAPPLTAQRVRPKPPSITMISPVI